MELINWIHWNNASLFSDKKSIERGNQALSVSSKMLSAMFENTAHRSWYWSGQLSNLAASVANQKDMPDRIYPRYPDFLRSQFSRSNATLMIGYQVFGIVNLCVRRIHAITNSPAF